MALGANVEVPFGDIPFILSDYFVLLAGLLLGGRLGGLAVVLYLLWGILGLPVFAGGTSGWERITGPTGGYLIGYLLAAVVAGFIANQGRTSLQRDALAAISGQALLFTCGIAGLMIVERMDLNAAYESGLAPFFIPILIKFGLAVFAAHYLRPLLKW
jgi:biotin transport system substrate-specific component